MCKGSEEGKSFRRSPHRICRWWDRRWGSARWGPGQAGICTGSSAIIFGVIKSQEGLTMGQVTGFCVLLEMVLAAVWRLNYKEQKGHEEEPLAGWGQQRGHGGLDWSTEIKGTFQSSHL